MVLSNKSVTICHQQKLYSQVGYKLYLYSIYHLVAKIALICDKILSFLGLKLLNARVMRLGALLQSFRLCFACTPAL